MKGIWGTVIVAAIVFVVLNKLADSSTTIAALVR